MGDPSPQILLVLIEAMADGRQEFSLFVSSLQLLLALPF